MRNVFLLFLLFVTMQSTINFGIAQPLIEWQKSFGGSGWDWAEEIEITSDGGYIVVGWTNSNDGDVVGSNGNFEMWILKLDNSGSLQWQKTLGGIGDEKAMEIEETNDGGYILVGYSSPTVFTEFSADVAVIKLDNAGNIEWQQTFGGSHNDYANSVQQTSDGGYIIAGSTCSNDGDVSGYQGEVGDNKVWLIKLDNAGTLLWQHCLAEHLESHAFSIKQSTDGGYIATGEASGESGISLWVGKFDNLGNLLWDRVLSSAEWSAGQSVELTSDGGFVVAGYSSYPGYDALENNGAGDMWVLKFDATGTLLWQKHIGGTNSQWAYSMQLTNDGGYVLSGNNSSNAYEYPLSHGESDFWVVKLDSVGTLQWEQCLGGTGSEWSTSIRQTNDGGYVLAGFSSSSNGDITENQGIYDMWVVKLATVNNVIQGAIYTDANADCIPDFTETRLPGRFVTITPGPYYSSTTNLGDYSAWVGSDNYTVSLAPKLYWSQDCPSSNGTYPVSFTGSDSVVTGINFSSYVSTFTADLSIGIGSAGQSLCFDNNIYVNVCNSGTIEANNINVSVYLPVSLIPVSSNVPWLVGDSGEYIFNIISLSPNNCVQIHLRDSVECITSLLGSVVCISASLSLNETDDNLEDNESSDCVTITGSYDPNDKRVASQNFLENGYVTQEDFNAGDTLRYMIRFQNTGSDTAITVVVRDTLSQWVEPTTIVTEVASHNYSFRLYGTGILEWTFSNILLPDSFANEPASHGFIKYHILPKGDMPMNMAIPNQADIYFDFNDPVITNQTISTLTEPNGINSLDINEQLIVNIFPNPSTGYFNLQFDKKWKGMATATIYSLTGMAVHIQNVGPTLSNIDMSSFPKGVYILELQMNDRKSYTKMVIQ